MELTIPVICLPAIVALVLKAAIYIYVCLIRVARSIETRLYFLFLLALVAQNLAEIVAIYRLNVTDTVPYSEAKLFYVSMIVAFAFLFQLSTFLAFREQHKARMILPVFVYAWATVLAMLVFSPWLIRDFVVFDYGIGYSVTRVPGHLYFLFELYVVCVFASVVGISFSGWKYQVTAKKRAQNGVFLAAIIPTALVMVLVIGLLHFDIKWINASVTVPIAISYFLVVSAYGIHHRRFFDAHTHLDEIADLRRQLAQAREEARTARDHGNLSARTPEGKTLDEHIAELEARLISQALSANNGNQAKAAGALGLRPNTLHYKIGRYGLSPKKRSR